MAPGQPPADLVELGRVTAAYGVKGWVKVQPHSAQAETLRAVKAWWLARPVSHATRGVVTSAPSTYRVLQARAQGATVVAQLEGILDRDQAEALRGCTVWVSRRDFPAAAEDEYYWVDLIGCLVYTNADGPAQLLGRVDEVFDNGAHAVLKVVRLQAPAEGGEPQPLRDAKGRDQEILVPFVGAHVQGVDLAARRIDSDWPADY
ncbi:ribosome maturation factor RimM [Bordetella sp. 2513F-2]